MPAVGVSTRAAAAPGPAAALRAAVGQGAVLPMVTGVEAEPVRAEPVAAAVASRVWRRSAGRRATPERCHAGAQRATPARSPVALWAGTPEPTFALGPMGVAWGPRSHAKRQATAYPG